MPKIDISEIKDSSLRAEAALKELQVVLARRAQTAGESINLLIDSARILQGSLRLLNKSIYDISTAFKTKFEEGKRNAQN